MDQRLKTALEYADYVTTFKNQKRVLQETYNKDCTVYYCGGQFTATREFITSVLAVKCDIFVDNNQTPIEVLNSKEKLQTIDNAIGDLSKTDFEIAYYYFKEELSYQEISEVMNISLGTVKGKISRARKSLQSKLVHV